MSKEELDMFLAILREIGGEAFTVAIMWLWLHYVSKVLVVVGVFGGLFYLVYRIVRNLEKSL